MRFFVEREIANFCYYLDTLEQTLNAKKQEVSKNVDMADTELGNFGYDDLKRKELIYLKVESEQLMGFSNLLRQSFLTSLYSFMELWLLRECYLDSKRRDSGNSYNEFKKDTGIIKVKRYHQKVLQSNFSFDTNKEWLWLNNLRLLRDCIVHKQGSLTGFSDFEANPILKSFVQNESGLSLIGVDNNQIFVDHDFCLKALETIHRFMLEFLSLKT